MSSAFRLCAAVTTVSSVVSLGYSTAAIRGSDDPGRANGLYAFSRSFALTTVTTAAVVTRSPGRLQVAAVAMILVQAGDAVIGYRARDRLKTIGPTLTAAANLFTLVNLVAGSGASRGPVSVVTES